MRLSLPRLTAIALVLALGPLALLAYSAVTLSGDAVRGNVEAKLSSTAAVSAKLVSAELEGLEELVESYAARPSLVGPLSAEGADATRARAIGFHLEELQAARPGIYTTFLTRPDGTLLGIVPATPSIVGKDFSFRDWYQGVTSTGDTYVSEAYETQATGQSLVVAVATPVRPADGQSREPVAILVAALSLEHLQGFTRAIEQSEEVRLKVTDQRGVLVASSGQAPRQLLSRAEDPRVAAALRGEAGLLELDTPDGHRLSAYAPVPRVGWTVTASVPTRSAFAAVSDLRSTVVAIAAALALVLVGGVALLARTWRFRERAERDARRLAEVNRAVLDAATEGIILFDPEGRQIVANAAIERIRAEALGLEPGGTLFEDSEIVAASLADPSGFRGAMAAIAADPERKLTEEFQVAESGRSFRFYTAPVHDVGGELGRIFTVRETTAERETERLKSELMATVSHELRTPLASILGFSELLVTREVDVATRERYLQTIYKEASRLTALINDFLDLQRMESGGIQLELEPFDLSDLLREQAHLFSGQSAAHELEVEVPGDGLTVLGERDRISQVIGNLLSNAIKYSPAGGSVHLSMEQRPGAVRVSVADGGLGIPADQQRQIFTKFFRVDSSDTRRIGGTGLGLALCREIVEAHGGHMGFESVEGEGSTFWFDLPFGDRANGGGRPRALVVEDDPAAASLLSEHLTDYGFAVEVASSGEAALASAAARPPTLVCLDIKLAGEVDGWHVLAALKGSSATASVPVVVCTGNNGREQAAALGAADFLTKPFSAERLRETVHRLLPAGGRSVLIVDDEDSVRRLVVETLGGNGLELREARGGAEALVAVAERRPDAIVLDLLMPPPDGFAVLERLQEDPATRSIPVLILTAHRLNAAERALLTSRAVSLLEKSAYSPADLRRMVFEAITRSGSDPQVSEEQCR